MIELKPSFPQSEYEASSLDDDLENKIKVRKG